MYIALLPSMLECFGASELRSFFLFFIFFFSFLFFHFFFLVVGFLVVLQVLLPADDWMIGWVRCASVVRYLPRYLPTAYRYPLPYEAYEA